MFRWLMMLACMAAALLGLAIATMNPDRVTLVVPGQSFSMTLGSLLVAGFVVGVIAGMVLFFLLFYVPARWTGRASKKSKESSLTRPNA